MLLASDGTLATVWAVSLLAGVAVLLVTALLLALLLRATQAIDQRTRAIRGLIEQISAAGARLALLGAVNETCLQLVDTGTGIAMATSRIMMHAAVCPGCPRCVTAAAAGDAPEAG